MWDTLTDGNIAEKKKRKRPNRNRAAAAAEAIPSLKTVEREAGEERGYCGSTPAICFVLNTSSQSIML